MIRPASLIRHRPALAAAALVLTAAFPAMAGVDSADLDVTATVNASCTISTVALGFGVYDPIVTHAAAALDGTGTVTVTCTNGSAVNITLGQGDNANAGSTDAVPLRRMLSGANLLSYYLYSDAARLTVWGNTDPTGLDDVGTGVASNLTVYGRIPAAQNVPVGAYADTVVATVTF